MLKPPAGHASFVAYVRDSWRILFKEISAFGLVGLISLVIDLSLFAWLSPDGALKAKCISTVVATVFAYFGNRYLSFSHRARSSIGRETSFFFGINLIVLVISELIIAFFVYPLHYGHGSGVVFVVTWARSAWARSSGSGPTSGSCSCTRTRCTRTTSISTRNWPSSATSVLASAQSPPPMSVS
jgi:putative flippase GtrA